MATWWEQLQAWLATWPVEEPIGEVVKTEARWVSADECPFGVEALDCRAFSQAMLSTTRDPDVTRRFMDLRGSRGDQHQDRFPPKSARHECELTYPPLPAGDGAVLWRATAMEEKWDFYRFGDTVQVARSWTDDLIFTLTIDTSEGDRTTVREVAVDRRIAEAPDYAVAIADYLLKSHVFGREMPHPLPPEGTRHPGELAIFSFSQYGRRAAWGAFADTTAFRIENEQTAKSAASQSRP